MMMITFEGTKFSDKLVNSTGSDCPTVAMANLGQFVNSHDLSATSPGNHGE